LHLKQKGKKPTEICFIESVRLVAFCVEENNQTNIYTLDCIRFHVQAQPGWQTFKHFRDEEKRVVFGGSLLTNIANLIQIAFDSFTHNVRQKSSTNYKFPFLCLSFCCAA
jgi:hypothetical protein